MIEKVRLNRKRKKRKIVGTVIDPPIPVLTKGYGSLMGKVMVGHAVFRNAQFITIELVEDDDTWREKYSLETGIRLSDTDSTEGWKINLADVEETADDQAGTFKVSVGDTGVKCLFRHRVPISDTSSALYEVWRDGQGHMFIKGVSEATNEKGKVSQRPRLIPFSILKRVLSDFETDWE